MNIFTSITLNYLPKAKILSRTLKKFHQDWKFHLLISDRIPLEKQDYYNQELSQGDFDHIVWIEDLKIPDIYSWIFKHTVVELCTAMKGIYLQLIANTGLDKIVYLDPDIGVFNSLSYLDELLDEYAILLCPHLLDYSDDPRSINENEIAGTMRHGTFNLGFLAVNNALVDGKRFVDWWANRLRDYCYADYDRGLFTDQKWCDLVPSFFENTFIIRDPGYDVASWNLDRRALSFDTEGRLLVNGKYLLRFYHFTGYDSGAGMSVLSEITKGGKTHIALELWDWYERKLQKIGHGSDARIPCFFDYFDNGEKIEQKMREVYRNDSSLQKAFPNPYSTQGGTGGYFSWWKRFRRTGIA